VPVEPPPGRPATLVKVLALASGPVPVEQAIELLWPGIDPVTGRQRLRNLLNRVKERCGELVNRHGEALELAPSADVDVRGFETASSSAFAAPAGERVGLARQAVAHYSGELLPADRYEPWTEAPRERLRRRYVELVELLVTEAVDRADTDEAVHLLDLAIGAEPFDEQRYVRAAELLLAQGRRSAARTFVDRAAAVLDELGLPPSPAIAALARRTLVVRPGGRLTA
jgi:DNA-binding SARP family transcriptional activator